MSADKIHMGITPQMANVVVMEIFLRAMEKVEFRTPNVSEADNDEVMKAKERFLQRMRENLIYARKQLR